MPSPAGAYADRLVASLAAAGVSDVVVCPGSRSQAIALAAARLARDGVLDVHVRIDERDAGFLALGLARETRAPVAIVVTSGTAVANLHPAMLEAHHADVPLIAVTADRPESLRGIRSNQTTTQPGIFGDAARVVVDVAAPSDDAPGTPEADAVAAVRAALGHRDGEPTEPGPTEPGPVQLNVALADPLSGGGPGTASRVDVVEPPERPTFEIEPAEGTVVVAGADAGPGAEAVAHALGAPLIAEPSSGARFGPGLVVAARELLASPLADEIRRVVVLGHPTLARHTMALVRRDDVEVVVAGRRRLENLRGTVHAGDPVVVGAPGPWARAWVGRWSFASREIMAADAASSAARAAPDPTLSRAAFARAELVAARARVTRRDLVLAAWSHTWPHDRLVLGASRLIRELDGVAPGKAITVHANRGLAGIDGTISTATGIAIALDREARGGMTRLLIGDLTLLHDVGGLLAGHGEEHPRMQIIVGNDRGGTIFDTLEVASTADERDFERVQRTPHAVDLAALAAAYGWTHVRASESASLERALTSETHVIIEVELD